MARLSDRLRQLEETTRSESEAIGTLHRNALEELRSELGALQQSALDSIKSDMDRASREAGQIASGWEKHLLAMQGSAFRTAKWVLLWPWIILAILYVSVPTILAWRAREGWSEEQRQSVVNAWLTAHGLAVREESGRYWVLIDPKIALRKNHTVSWAALPSVPKE
jgi:hypothetical protein